MSKKKIYLISVWSKIFLFDFKSHLSNKIKSGALQLTIFIGILIALLLFGLILYIHTFNFTKEQSITIIENIKLADTATNIVLKQKQISEDTITINFNSEKNHIFKTNLTQWGVFEKTFVTVINRKKSFSKSSLIGSQFNINKSPTLYLQETYKPLTVVGSTIIRGKAYLPIQGVQPGFIAGQSFNGSKLIQGELFKSGKKLPDLEKKYLKNLIGFKTKNFSYEKLVLTSDKKIINSFKYETKQIYSKKPIILNNLYIAGNIIIKSDTLVSIRQNTFLEDVIIIAPIVEINDVLESSFQVIASKKIIVGKNCKLNFPSSLILINEDNTIENTDKFDNQIFIDSGSEIKGLIGFLQTKNINSDFNTQIHLAKNAILKGQIYCQGNLELNGTVYGSIYTKQFIANQSGSIFINHVYNGSIINEKIPENYGGFVFENEKKIVLKWLY